MSKIGTYTDAQLEELENKANSDEGLTEEQRTALLPQEDTDDNKDGELIVELPAEPVKGEDKQDAPPPATDNPDEPPPPATDVKSVTDEQYNAILAEHPELAKFKNDADFIKNLSNSYVELEKKLGSPKQPAETTPPPITDEQKIAELNKTIFIETERAMLSDSIILDNLVVRDENNAIVEVLTLPKTTEEWANFKREHPAEYIEIKQRGNEIYNAVNKSVTDYEQKLAYVPTANKNALDKAIQEIGDYYKKLAPNASAEDLKKVEERLKVFVPKALDDVKFYTKDGNVFFLNPDLLKGQFIADTVDLGSALAVVNANNSSHDKVADAVKNAQKKTSMKTLASAGMNQTTARKINLSDKRQISQMSDAELDRLNKVLLES